jgi:hypothetical protein
LRPGDRGYEPFGVAPQLRRSHSLDLQGFAAVYLRPQPLKNVDGCCELPTHIVFAGQVDRRRVNRDA